MELIQALPLQLKVQKNGYPHFEYPQFKQV